MILSQYSDIEIVADFETSVQGVMTDEPVGKRDATDGRREGKFL